MLELEERICKAPGCKGKFKVLPGDPQLGCRKVCNDEIKKKKLRPGERFFSKPRRFGKIAQKELEAARLKSLLS